jgi:hypothetical protein
MSLSTSDKYLLNKMNTIAGKVQLGTQLSDALAQVALAEAAVTDAEAAQVAAEAAEAGAIAAVGVLKKVCVKAQYSFDSHGGAQGDILLGVSVPDNAIAVNVVLDVLVQPTSLGSATVAFKLQAAADLLAATAKASLTVGLLQGKPVHSDLTKAIKTTASREITATIGAADLTDGKINVFVEYFISD